LSPHWRGVLDQRNPLIRYVPFWVVAGVAAALLLLAYALFNWLLNKASDPVLTALADIRGQTMATVRRGGVTATAAAVKIDRRFCGCSANELRAFLDPQVRQGLVKVIEDPQQTTVRIRGDGLFDSGSANVKPAFLPLLQQIGKELNTVQGRVLVTGHSAIMFRSAPCNFPPTGIYPKPAPTAWCESWPPSATTPAASSARAAPTPNRWPPTIPRRIERSTGASTSSCWRASIRSGTMKKILNFSQKSAG
jgi:hypothetical protein